MTEWEREARVKHLKAVRENVLEALNDVVQRITEGRPRFGKHWPPGMCMHLHRWWETCQKTLNAIDAELKKYIIH